MKKLQKKLYTRLQLNYQLKQNLLRDNYGQEKEDKKLTKDQAEKKILSLKKIYLILDQKINNQVNNPAQYNQIKKSIARLYTTIKNTK